MTGLNLGHGLTLPLTMVTEPIGVLANRGRGKSSTTRVLVEEMHDQGIPVVVLDVKGDWWGLRSPGTGKAGGLPFIIFGGDHADVPLEPTAGELLADLVVDERVSVVLDMSAMSKTKARSFTTTFAERLYRRNREPLFLVVDEADVLIPQRASAETARLLGAMEDLAKRGRGRGLGIAVVTQRPQEVAKSVLDLMDTLVLLGMTGPRSLKAVREWIGGHVDEDTTADQVMASLPSLPVGQAWVWSPMQHLLKQVTVRRIRTFDSHATPQPGEVRAQPRGRADVDLAALGEAISATVERAKADDPRALRARVAELERELQVERDRPVPEPVVQIVEVPVLAPEIVDQIEAALSPAAALLGEAQETLAKHRMWAEEQIHGRTDVPRTRPASGGPDPVGSGRRTPERRDPPAGRDRGRQAVPRPASAEGDVALGKTERNILTVLAQHGEVNHGTLALLSGYSPKASTIGVSMGKLRKAGLVEPGQPYRATQAGVDALGGQVEPLPEGQALIDYWRHRFGATERNVLDAFLAVWPDDTSQAEVAEQTGYSATASTIGVSLGKLRKVGVIDRWRISDDFANAVGLR